jgi:hypothetical protein
MSAKHQQRFPVEPGSLRESMRCGAVTDQINGIVRAKDFQPTYFTADWTDGVLVQVRLWGPQILSDGTLGERDLDYRWKKTGTTGPIRYPDLPGPLRRRLLDYNVEMNFTVLPEQM